MGKSTVIKDLFNSKYILNKFDRIEFESIQIFLKCINDEYIDLIGINNEISINIKSEDDLKLLKDITIKSELSKVLKVILNIDTEVIFQKLLKEYNEILECNFPLSLNFIPSDGLITLYDKYEKFKKFGNKNPIILNYKIQYDNYVEKFNMISEILNTKGYRFFNIEFDYESFQKMTFDELYKLEFYINVLKGWERPTTPGFELHILHSKKLFKPVFVSNNLELKFCENSDPFFIITGKDKTGEDYSNKEINGIRQYLDLTEESIYSPIDISKGNKRMINYFVNKTIETSINEIPLISGFIISLFHQGKQINVK